MRKKKWNYWCVTSDTHLFSATVSDIDYLGLAFVYYLHFDSKAFTEKTVAVPFGWGCDLPDTVEGDIAFDRSGLQVSFRREPGPVTRLEVASQDFGGVPLEADLSVEHPRGHETLNVVVPWSETRFQFTSKQNCLPASGVVRLGGETIVFERGKTFACLDFGRGVWPYSSCWNWASFSGAAEDGTRVGVNLGAGWTDGTGMTENALWVDGRVAKLSEEVVFSYDPADFMRPWRLRTSESDRVELEFIPFFERVAKTDLLLLKSEVHQMIGRFSGTVAGHDGRRLRVEGVVGWAEEHRARW